MLKGSCLGFLDDAGCGLIYADEPCLGSRIVFVHFRDIAPEQDGWQTLKAGDRVSFVASTACGETFYRACAAVGEDHGFVHKIDDKRVLQLITVKDLVNEPIDATKTYVITGEIPLGWQPATQLFTLGDILFFACSWGDKAQFSSWQVAGDLVFLGCSFADAFSLKSSCVAGAVHMEGCNFSGAGGASFRGLQAKALYLDFGVKGPRDMVWLNEMYIQHDVVIGGDFSGSIQIMRSQDKRVGTSTSQENEAKNRACFQHLRLGKAYYKSQNINRTVLHGALEIHGLCHGEHIHIEHTQLAEVSFVEIAGGVALYCEHSKVLGSVLLRGKNRAANIQHISFKGSYIEGHCEVRSMLIQHDLVLDDATVERVVRMAEIAFVEGGMRLARLCANRLVMDDFQALYGKAGLVVWWRNPRFMMLSRERSVKGLADGPPVALIQEYVLLKHLLSQEGQLKLEDEAFYNMRKLNHWYQDLGMLVFNGVFGWGVRLQNILCSVFVLVLLFSALYHMAFTSFTVLEAVQLSIQSMFMAFFGELSPKVMAGSALSWLVLLESILGVVFVTVFVGAYVRKLLR